MTKFKPDSSVIRNKEGSSNMDTCECMFSPQRKIAFLGAQYNPSSHTFSMSLGNLFNLSVSTHVEWT